MVASLARPGGNLTGLSLLSPELSGKRVELLRETGVTISRVAILLNPDNPVHPSVLRETRAAVQALHGKLHPVQARRPEELDGAFAAIVREGVRTLVVPLDSIFNAHRARITELANHSRIAAMYGEKSYVVAGGLIAYGPSYPHLWRRAAGYVDRILKGTPPAALPVEQPTTFELSINLRAADAIGLIIPTSLLLRADHVIR